MSLEILSFLAEPWFVVPWYAVGILGAAAVAYDVTKINTPLKKAMKWAWPIIALFFSVIGLALYYGTARAPGIGRKKSMEDKKKAHREYQKNELRRVNGAVIHCIAGDGLGIMTGMVIARATGMSFWEEFWFEYAVGFAFGWFIFQYKSMTMMTDSKPKALAMAFRGEFFSMLTVMAGMGLVMGFVTPLSVTAQPKPLTYGFWGFGMLGLLLGYVFTFPMNWMMVKLGWKHGMGPMKDNEEVEAKPARFGLITACWVLGAAALALLGWAVEIRDNSPVARGDALEAPTGAPVERLGAGLQESIDHALTALRDDRRAEASHALDAAHRAAQVGQTAAPGSAFADVLHDVENARRALHIGNEGRARSDLESAAERARNLGSSTTGEATAFERYAGATVVDANGVMIGEVVRVDGDRAELALGGPRDVFGFWDIGAVEHRTFSSDELVLGPRRGLGSTLVALPEVRRPPAVAELRTALVP